MSVIKFDKFFCEFPRVAGVKLPEGYASASVNTDVAGGYLRGFWSAGTSSLPANTKAALFYDAARTYTWTEDADAVRSPVVDVTGGRFYWTSASSNGLQVSTTFQADEYKTYAQAARDQASAYLLNPAIPADQYMLVTGWKESRGFASLSLAADDILKTVNTALTPQFMSSATIPVGFYEVNPYDPKPYYKHRRVGVHSDIVGVPRPPRPPAIFELIPVIGHLVADFELSIANERKGGALTEVTSLTVGDSDDASGSTNYNVDPIDEAAVDTLIQSVVYKVNPRKTEYVLAKAGANQVNDLLRTEYAYYRNNTMVPAWASLTSQGVVRPKFSSPALFGKAVIGGTFVGEEPSGLTLDGVATTLARWDGGTEVDIYYADDGSTVYIRATGDLAKGEFIRDVAVPTFAANYGQWIDLETGTYYPAKTNGVITVGSLADTHGRVTFRRCLPRNGDYSSSWYYYTLAYCPLSTNLAKLKYITPTSQAYPFGEPATHEQLKEFGAAYAGWANCIAYKVALTPVVANDTDSAGGLESLGPVLIMNAWLAERDLPVPDTSGNWYGKITGDPYVEGEKGIFVDDMEFRARVGEAGNASAQQAARDWLRTKLTKVQAVFRLDGNHTIPEQLKAVTASFILPDIKTIPNNVQPWPANKFFTLGVQTKYENTEARAYVATYVNEWGEEGPPSDPLLISDVPQDGRMRLRVPVYLWDAHRCAPIHRVRLYRTATGSQSTEFLFVNEWDVGNASDVTLRNIERTGALITEAGVFAPVSSYIVTRYEYLRTSGTVMGGAYASEGARPLVGSFAPFGHVYLALVDSKRGDELAEPLSTQTYYMPAYLDNSTGNAQATTRPSCLRLMHNGMLAFMEGGNVWISEPYLPYAFNPSAVQNLPHDVVTICPTENYLFAATKGEPFLLTGNTPDTITNQRVPSVQSGVSKWGSVRVGDGVIYASPDGLVMCSGLNADLSLSSKLFTSDKWKGMFPHQDTLGLAVQDNFLFVWCYNAGGGYSGIIDLSNPQAGITRYAGSQNNSEVVINPVRAAIVDNTRDVLHLARQQSVETLFSGSARTPFTHMTRRVELPKPESMSVVQVLGTGTVTVSVLRFNPTDATDEAAVVVKEKTLNLAERNWFRLPGGSVSRWWLVKVVGGANAEVFSIILASSMQELKGA